MVSHDPNPFMYHDSFHSSHVKEEALGVPPEKVHKLSTNIDKMLVWILQENQNTNIIAYFDALKKVIHYGEHGVNI